MEENTVEVQAETTEVKEKKPMFAKIKEKAVGLGKWIWSHKGTITAIAGAAAAGAAVATAVQGGNPFEAVPLDPDDVDYDATELPTDFGGEEA